MAPEAPRNTQQAIAFNAAADRSNTQKYYRMCQKLQREARGLPAVYPTAASAQAATPAGERVGLTGLRPGMVAFTKGSNPAGHIVLVKEWKSGPKTAANLMVYSNDMAADGRGVALVPLSKILGDWRHSFQFGAGWLNGYNFNEFDAPVPTRGPKLKNYQHAIDDIKAAIEFHKKGGNTELVKLLKRDLAYMRESHKNLRVVKAQTKK